MPEYTRKPINFTCRGVNLSHPLDTLPPSTFPLLQNVRVNTQGGVCSRPGQAALYPTPLPDEVHSIRRLNNITDSDFIRLIGAGTDLYSQTGSADPVLIDSTYSGNPLSMVRFRPDQSPSPWMYIGDSTQLKKVATDGTVRPVGYAPPVRPPVAELSDSNDPLTLSAMESTVGWSTAGTGAPGAPAAFIRVSTTIASVLYDSGSSGWACVVPNSSIYGDNWMQTGVLIRIGGVEHEWISEASAAISAANISTIIYDGVAATGMCTVTLNTNPSELKRNSVITIGGTEQVRVLSVSASANGKISFRTSTSITHVVGEAVTGQAAIRVWSAGFATVGAAIDASYINFGSSTGVALLSSLNSGDYSKFSNGRKVALTDFIHISLMFDDAAKLTSGRLLIDVDASVNDFKRNYYEYEFTPEQLNAGFYAWTELLIPVSEFVRVGTDLTRDWSTVVKIGVEVTLPASTSANTFVGGWQIIGGFGPVTPPGTPTGSGVFYRHRYRDSTTNARSVPGPATEYPLLPLHQAVLVTVTGTAQVGVDVIDIERLDPVLQTGTTPIWTYVGTVNNPGAGFSINFSDEAYAQAIATNPALETNVFQPFVRELPSITGIVNVSGTVIQYVSGDPFPSNLIAGTIIKLGNLPYQFTGQLGSNRLFLSESADNSGSSIAYTIDSPSTFGNPAQVFGPLEGESSIFMFAVGDPDSPGTIRWTNGNDLDSTDSINFRELTSPSERLFRGVVWNSYVFVGTRDRLFMLSPALNTSTTFTVIELPTKSGPISDYAMCAGDDGVYYVGRDGLYRATPYNPTERITDSLYSLFPHEGKAGVLTNSIYYPIDYSTPSRLRISYADGDLYFDYRATDNQTHTLRRTAVGRDESGGQVHGWFPYDYGDQVNFHYLDEVGDTTVPQLLQCTITGSVKVSTGETDSGTDIGCRMITRFDTLGDLRDNKLVSDQMISLNPDNSTFTYYIRRNLSLTGGSLANGTFGVGVSTRSQLLISVHGGLGSLANSVALDLSWVGGTVDRAVYEWVCAYVTKPATTTTTATDWTDDGNPGAKFVRGLIIEADTRDSTGTPQTRSVEVRKEGETTAYTTLQVNHNGQLELPYGVIPFMAHTLQLYPIDSASWQLFKVTWVWDKYPEFSTIIPEDYSDLGAQTSKYIRGLVLEADTANALIPVTIQTEGNLAPTTIFIQHPGRSEKPYYFDPPFIAHALRLYQSADCRIFNRSWIYDTYPEYTSMYSSWEDGGYSGPKYIRGARVKADTANLPVQFDIQADGGTIIASPTITANGQQTVAIEFNPPLTAYLLRVFPSSNWRFFGVEWIYDEYPDLIPMITSWDDDGYIGAKWLQGAVIEADTAGTLIPFTVEGDAGVTLTNQTGTHTGKQQVAYSWEPVITHNMRIVPGGNMRVWRVKWVWERIPELATRWVTQPLPYGLESYGTTYYAIVHYQSTSQVYMNVVCDGVTNIYTLPNTAGVVMRYKVVMSPVKGRLFTYELRATNPFRLYKGSSIVYLRDWNTNALKLTQPFGDAHNEDGARI